jgi:hypothetical protein
MIPSIAISVSGPSIVVKISARFAAFSNRREKVLVMVARTRYGLLRLLVRQPITQATTRLSAKRVILFAPETSWTARGREVFELTAVVGVLCMSG